MTFVQVAQDDYVKRHCWALGVYRVSSSDLQIERLGHGVVRIMVQTSDQSRPFVFMSESRFLSRWKSRAGVLEKALDEKRLLPLAGGSLVNLKLNVSPNGKTVFEPGVDAERAQEEYFSEESVSRFF